MSRQLNVAMFSNHFVARNGEGIARYANHLHDAINAKHLDIALTPVSSWRPGKVHNLAQIQKRLDIRFLPWGKRSTGLSWVFFKRPFLESGLDEHVDIVHPLSVFYPVPTRKPMVVTIHDIMPITHPEFFPKVSLVAHFMKTGLDYVIKHADAIICVSQATANELELYAKRNLGDRLHVIWEGVDPTFLGKADKNCLSEIASFPAMGVPFVLSVGGVVERKNIGRLIQAMECLKDEIPHHLVLVGGAWRGTEEILRQCQESSIADRIHYLGYVSDQQLHALYSLAKAFVFVSLFEGFGLPVVEALASGCPVVTSNISSLPEVAGNAASLVDPYKVSEIAEAIREICMDESFARELSERGRLRGEAFRWDRCAEQVAAIYRQVV